MGSTVLSGLRLLVPYLIGMVVTGALLAVAARVFRGRIGRLLARVSPSDSPRDGALRFCLLFAVAILVFFAAIELVAGAGFAIGLSMHPALVALAAAIGGVALHFSARALAPAGRAWHVTAAVTIAATLAIGAGLVAAGLFYDISWDGNWYHQQAVAAIADGWNPVRDPEGTTVRIGEWAPDLEPGGIWEFAVTHYAKGGWVRQAALYALTGSIEHGKATNAVLGLVLIAVWLALGLRVFPAGRWRPALATALVALNPVIVVQTLTFKNDVQVGSLLTIAVGLGCLVVGGIGGWPTALALACALLMLATIKFTGLVYAVMLAAGFAAAYVWRRRGRQPVLRVAVALAALLVATLLAGYNPYVTNTLAHGSPFYPLMGPGAIDASSPEWPAASWPNNFKGASAIERLGLSLFSRSADEVFLEPGGADARLKVPFTIGMDEIRPYMGVDTRIAGFGPLFGGALLLSLALLVMLVLDYRRTRDPVLGGGLALVGLLLATILVNPESWWARYAPQMWLVPVVLIGLGLRTTRRYRTIFVSAIATVLVLNALFVEGINFTNHLNGTHEITAALNQIDGWTGTAVLDQGDFAVTWLKFEERGIPWRLIEEGELPMGDGLAVPYTTTTAYIE